MEQYTRMNKEEIPFDKLEKVGINRDFVTHMESNELRDFLNGFRSEKLYTVNATVDNQEYKIPAKIRLQKQEDGSVNVRIHPIQRLFIPDEYMGHSFTKGEKAALLGERNLGKTIELTGRDGKKDTYYLGVDNKTNELIPLRTKHIQVPDRIKGVALSEEQKQKLAAGGKVTLEGMTGRNGKKFGATLQVDAANRNISFSGFKQEKEQALEQKQEKSKGLKPKAG
ncbi:Protein of unknown function [Mariniphaga anaerophila]|uniref:Uncharacterized protein n=1 Tax=Mariniphaga anaerophila TaxID=1484053 RepID=A0A1M4SUQ0_9BACT|nr:DUF3945 domain-containing protein [Mariniphaga anaerophila]SHE35902.1 Protein of unknown function [Mariniphaga anaerophila]